VALGVTDEALASEEHGPERAPQLYSAH
jgi:hypothetical protein